MLNILKKFALEDPQHPAVRFSSYLFNWYARLVMTKLMPVNPIAARNELAQIKNMAARLGIPYSHEE